MFLYITLEDFDSSLSASVSSLWSLGPKSFAGRHGLRSSVAGILGFLAWILFQAGLYTFLPTKPSSGQLTPAGYLLQYKTNGLLAWSITVFLALFLVFNGNVHPALLATHWEGLLIAANVYGCILSVLVYLKAFVAPSHAEDRKFSGSMIYDFYMGIELNPRLGGKWDLKLFHIGRIGIVAWTLIDLSYVTWQYQLHGFVTNSILIASFFHAIYVVDFFVNEDWYLRTIDICHDHFGFYLAWASVAWLPAVYTLHSQYLARHPVELSPLTAAVILVVGLGSYAFFRDVNYQKDLVRRTKGQCVIWGETAEVITCSFRTTDGLTHESLLLCSGWWGTVRHANYLGDLVLSFAMCATCGTTHLLPWTYGLFMMVLLMHRCFRDEDRCSMKYGDGWKTYCDKVKWRMVPGLF